MSGSGVDISRMRRRWIAPAFTILLCAVSLTACSGGRNSFWNDGPKYGPRVIPLGQPVPKGGGRFKLGSPYRDAEGRVYVPKEEPRYDRTGIASWYGEDFHGRRTANGEIYDMEALTAAHTTLPLPSYVRVTNLKNGRSLVVRVNDRGPYVDNRIIDLSWAVASLLQIESMGTGPVRVQYLGPAPLDGNDKHERHILAQQPWAGPRVAYAGSPAKALRNAGGWQQYSSNTQDAGSAQNGSGTEMASAAETPVREKFIRDRLTPAADTSSEQRWLMQPDGAASQKMTATIAVMSADEAEGAAPRRAPISPVKPVVQPAQLQPKPVIHTAKAATPLQPQPRKAWGATAQPVRLAAKVSVQSSPAPSSKVAPRAPVLAGSVVIGPVPTPAQPVLLTQNASIKATTAPIPAAAVHTEKPSGIYIEAGVFRERALADKLSAILTEIAPATVELTTSGTEIVHRVKVGPFEKTEAAEAAATRIRAAGLNSARIMPARGI